MESVQISGSQHFMFVNRLCFTFFTSVHIVYIFLDTSIMDTSFLDISILDISYLDISVPDIYFLDTSILDISSYIHFYYIQKKIYLFGYIRKKIYLFWMQLDISDISMDIGISDISKKDISIGYIHGYRASGYIRSGYIYGYIHDMDISMDI